MIPAKKTFKKLVLVCVNERQDGRECCAQKGSENLYQELKIAIAGVDPSVRVSKTGCLGNCATGTTVVIMPDNLYLGRVSSDDIQEIINIVTDIL